MKFLVWNIRGLRQSSKKSIVKDLTSKLCPSILALLETKLPEPNLQLIRIGASGGIWMVWDPSEVTLHSYFIGLFFVTVLLSCISDGTPLKFTAVYGPTTSSLRSRLWSELGHVASLSHPIWCLGGDFNVTRWSHEQNFSNSISPEMRDFSNFISRIELLDIPLQGSWFTWSNHASNPTLSKLDRFLLSLEWEDVFPRSSSLVLPKPTSDHCPILHDTAAIRRGPRPLQI
ncbi:hypothetical protein AMTRI_Chr13g122930 [Amborella trichopoda]